MTDADDAASINAQWEAYLKDKGLVHCDDVLDGKVEVPPFVKRFIRIKRWPATWQFRAVELGVPVPTLYATHEGQRVRVTMASCHGDLGITPNLKQDTGYRTRVFVNQLTDFSPTP